MVLTPQLLQAIKLLQLPSLELAAFIKDEVERNPLLELEDAPLPDDEFGAPAETSAPEGEEDWASEQFETDATALAAKLGTEIENAFDCAPAGPAARCGRTGRRIALPRGLERVGRRRVRRARDQCLRPDLPCRALAKASRPAVPKRCEIN